MQRWGTTRNRIEATNMIDLLLGQLILHLFVDHISREIDKKDASKKPPVPVVIVPAGTPATATAVKVSGGRFRDRLLGEFLEV
jgi:hypothetical protein